MIKRITQQEADRLITPHDGPASEVLMLGGGRFYHAVDKTIREFSLLQDEWQNAGKDGGELPSFPMGVEVSLPDETPEKNERVLLSYEDAVSMLPDGKTIHTFVNPRMGVVLGADWSRESILELFKTGKPELSGATATSMGHGIVVWRKGEGALFIETVEGVGK